MKKIIMLSIFFLISCSNGLSNPYEPVYKGKNSFPENGKGIVSVEFTSEFMGSPLAVATVWNKMTNEGGLDRNIRLTYNGAEDKGANKVDNKPQRVELMLEPGRYVLNKVSNSISVGIQDEIAYITKNKKPNWLLLTVEEGKVIKYPTLKFSSKRSNGELKLKITEFKNSDDNGKWIYGDNIEYDNNIQNKVYY